MEKGGSHVKRVMTKNDETEVVSQYNGYQPNNVWSGLEHLGTHEHVGCGEMMPDGKKASCRCC